MRTLSSATDLDEFMVGTDHTEILCHQMGTYFADKSSSDSFNKAPRDEDITLDQINTSNYVRIIVMKIKIPNNIL